MTHKVILLTDIDELVTQIGKSVYLFGIEDSELTGFSLPDGGNFVATTRKFDMDKFLEQNDILQELTGLLSNQEYILIYGVVLSPKKLIYTLPKELNKCTIYIFQKEIDIIECVSTLIEAAAYIEDCFIRDETDDINDFIVVVGEEIDMMAQIATSDVASKINIKAIEG